MELVHILKSLWVRKYLVAVAFVLAVAVAAALHSKGTKVQGGTASAEILIDAEQSALGDLRRDTLPLVARSGIFARFLGADGVTDAIAREAGIPVKDIAVIGPKLRIDGVPDQEAAERASQMMGAASHLLQVQQGDDLPLLTIYTQAPSPEGARKLANGTADALEAYVSRYQEEVGIPEKRRVAIRQLGEARASEFESAPGVVLPFMAFCVVFGLSCLAVIAWPNVKAAWRSPQSRAVASGWDDGAAWAGDNTSPANGLGDGLGADLLRLPTKEGATAVKSRRGS
jgi:capsular polysaccharide biosynthesis protein